MTGLSKTVRVEVTADDIAAGWRGDATHCPVALALNRTYPVGGGMAVGVGQHKGRLAGIGHFIAPSPLSFRLSERVGRFVQDFDNGKPVKPFAFRVWR